MRLSDADRRKLGALHRAATGNPWPWGPWTSPPVVALAAYPLGVGLRAVGVPPTVVAVGGGLCALGAVGAVMVRHVHGIGVGYAALVSGLMATWLTWAAGHRTTTAWSVAALVLGVVAVLPLYIAVVRRDERRRAPITLPTLPAGYRYEQLMAEVGLRGLRFVARAERRGGYTLRFSLPAAGVTFRAVADAVDRIEQALDAAFVGAVRVSRGEHGVRDVLVHVNTEDVLAEEVPLPVFEGAASINEPLAIGRFDDYTDVRVRFRELAGAILAQKGRGKTNLLNVLIYQLTRCPDNVTVLIDPKGDLGVPWLMPYALGVTDRPVLAAVASGREEIVALLTAVREMGRVRVACHDGEDKIVPSAALPQITVLIEEMSRVAADPAAVRLLSEIIAVHRAEAIDVYLASQRSTITMLGSTDISSQLGLRIAMGCSDAGEAYRMLEQDVRTVDVTKFRHPGSMYVRANADVPARPARAYRISSADIPGYALARTPGVLDAPSAAAGGSAFSSWWCTPPALELLRRACAAAARLGVDLGEQRFPVPLGGASASAPLGGAAARRGPRAAPTLHEIAARGFRPE